MPINKLEELEHRISAIEGILGENLKDITEELKLIRRGIYGDLENQALGLIDSQKLEAKRLADLEERVLSIEKGILGKSIEVSAKYKVLSKVKEIAIVVISAYLILKDVLGLETIAQWIFR